MGGSANKSYYCNIDRCTPSERSQPDGTKVWNQFADASGILLWKCDPGNTVAWFAIRRQWSCTVVCAMVWARFFVVNESR